MSLHEAPGSILVINVSRIGDTLLATPAVRALAKAWPKARITFLGHPKRVQIVENLPCVAATGGITKHRARWRGWLSARRYDLALVLGFDRPLVAYALRVARRAVAFRQRDAALDARLYRCVEPPGFQSMHAAQIPLLLTRALGVPDAGLRLGYAVTEGEKRWAGETLAAKLPRGAAPLVGLQVASFPTKAFRDWPIESFLLLCERILQRWQGAHLLVFGGELELARTAAVTGRFPGRVTSFAGAVTLRQSAALMNELDVYVGVDTGPTHIMGALSAPMVPLYHCQSPSRLLMPLERARCYVVDHPRAAQGCGPETPMSEIPVDAVWARVLEALPGR
jgi:heptosyltransferase-3